jgi:small subunit ribosomal protein S9
MERVNAVGRRKASVARVYVTNGSGKVSINGK